MIEQYLLRTRTLAEVLTTTETMAYAMGFTAIVTLPVLLFGPTAPYGRFSTTGWGFLINNKIAWITQEIPSLDVPVVWMTCYATPSQLSNLQGRNLILMLLFCIHYTNRDLIYPLRLRGGKPTPFVVLWALTSAVHITFSLAL